MKRETTSESPRTGTEWAGTRTSEGGSVEPTTTEERLAELIAGFLSRNPVAEAAFIIVLRPILRAEVRLHWTGLWRHIDDFEQEALAKLCELRETAEGREKIAEPLEVLAKYLIEGPARKLMRAPKWVPLDKKWDRPGPSNQEATFEISRLSGLASGLPESMTNTLLCHAAHVMGEGPPLHIALDVSVEAARFRLSRAQAAVHRLANGEEIEVADE
jgi:hypothetical protein